MGDFFCGGKEYGHANLAFQYTSDGSTFIHPQPLAILTGNFRTVETYEKGQSEQYA